MNLDFVVALEKRASLFSYSRSVKHIVHFYFLRDFDIGMHHHPEFETHCNSNKKFCYHLSFLATQFENIVHFLLLSFIFSRSVSKKYRAFLLRDNLDIGCTIFPVKFDMVYDQNF